MSERTGEYLTNRDHGDESPPLPPGRAPGEIGAADDERPGRPTEAQLAEWARLRAAAAPGRMSRVKSLAARYWTIGRIIDHQAEPLTDDADWDYAEAAWTALPRLLAYVASLRETLAFTLTERQEWRRRAEDRAVAHRADIDRLVALEAEAARLRARAAVARAAVAYLGTFDEVVEEQISVNHLAVAGGRSRDTDRRMTARHEQVFALRAVLRDAIAALTPEQRAELEASDGG